MRERAPPPAAAFQAVLEVKVVSRRIALKQSMRSRGLRPLVSDASEPWTADAEGRSAVLRETTGLASGLRLERLVGGMGPRFGYKGLALITLYPVGSVGRTTILRAQVARPGMDRTNLFLGVSAQGKAAVTGPIPDEADDPEGSSAFRVGSGALQDGSFGNEAGLEVAPQRHSQFARHGDDGDAPHAALLVADALEEPLGERAEAHGRIILEHHAIGLSAPQSQTRRAEAGNLAGPSPAGRPSRAREDRPSSLLLPANRENRPAPASGRSRNLMSFMELSGNARVEG